MRRFKRLNAFQGADTPPQRSLGGAQTGVTAASDAMKAQSMPTVAARIYAPGAIKNFDQDDPRYDGKSDNVENIYLPTPIEAKPRSGVAQMWNWLTKGELK